MYLGVRYPVAPAGSRPSASCLHGPPVVRYGQIRLTRSSHQFRSVLLPGPYTAPNKFLVRGPAAVQQEQQSATSPQQQTGSKEDLTPINLTWPGRTHGAGTLRAQQVGEDGIVLCGWVDRNRDMGGVQFFDIRDHTGILQVITGTRGLLGC